MAILFISIFTLDAVHIFFLLSFCYNFIGNYRVNKKVIVLWGVMFWVLSCFLRLMPVSQKASGAAAFLWLAEMVFVFCISFAYMGRIAKRLLCAVCLPVLYWGGQWIISMILYGSAFIQNKDYLISMIISLVFFAIFTVTVKIVRKSKQERERKMLEQEIRIYENQFEVIRQSQKNMRSLRHDLRHHVKMLSDMIESDDKESALQYLVSMGAFMENSEEYVSSGNERIDSILNYMVSKAKKAGISTECKVQIPEHLNISTFDINVILSNLFNNAFQALREVEVPELSILLKYDRGVLCIRLHNNHTSGIAVNNKPKSFLEEISQEHGYGLKNVQRIAKKYHGSLSISNERGIFSVSVLLFLTGE